ncbi:MAG: hypothetical protein CL608_12100 [Anaerolineaceae bacterium]|nr:hypothetical protein [Anaerolineaceae bacterium]
MSNHTETHNNDQNCGTQACCQEQNTSLTKVETLVYSPDVDIIESDTGIDLKFDMPGVDQEQLDISIAKDVLTVVGHADLPPVEGYQYLYREFRGGDYRRAFRLPDAIDAQHVEATIKQGILTIHIPKAQRQTVTVKAV